MALFFGWTYATDFRDWVSDARALERVKSHQSPVFREGQGYKLVRPGVGPGRAPVERPLMGLTSLMSTYLYVHDRRVAKAERKRRKEQRITMKAIYGRASPAPGAQLKTKRCRDIAKSTSPLSMLRGHELGSLVHRQVMDVLFCSSSEDFVRRPGNQWGLHPFVPRLIHLLLERQVRPFDAEYRTHSEEITCATQIDVLGVDKRGRIVFVELKTGYGLGRFDTEEPGEVWTVPILAKNRRYFPCTPRNKGIIQLVLGAEMCIRQLGLSRQNVRYILLRVDDAGNNIVEVNPNFAQLLSTELYHHVMACQQRERR